MRYPPNNWASLFGGSAWEFYEETGMYNLHIFAKVGFRTRAVGGAFLLIRAGDQEQPDLNWANPEVRKQIFDDCNWWLARGVDGFRVSMR